MRPLGEGQRRPANATSSPLHSARPPLRVRVRQLVRPHHRAFRLVDEIAGGFAFSQTGGGYPVAVQWQFFKKRGATSTRTETVMLAGTIRSVDSQRQQTCKEQMHRHGHFVHELSELTNLTYSKLSIHHSDD